jgi:hypothetical protein
VPGVDDELAVVPWVSLFQHAETQIVSERVAAASIDQSADHPALDRIAPKDGGS